MRASKQTMAFSAITAAPGEPVFMNPAYNLAIGTKATSHSSDARSATMPTSLFKCSQCFHPFLCASSRVHSFCKAYYLLPGNTYPCTRCMKMKLPKLCVTSRLPDTDVRCLCAYNSAIQKHSTNDIFMHGPEKFRFPLNPIGHHNSQRPASDTKCILYKSKVRIIEYILELCGDFKVIMVRSSGFYIYPKSTSIFCFSQISLSLPQICLLQSFKNSSLALIVLGHLASTKITALNRFYMFRNILSQHNVQTKYF